MADAVKIRVELRDPAKNKGTGTKFARRLRKQGRIPAIIYGHKQAPTPISMSRESVWEMIKKQTHLAELEMDGAGPETVMVREIQWDYLGKEIIHLDFARVSAGESIETEVRIDLRGTAPGTQEGGVLEQLIHSIEVTCRADAIPDNIKLDISELHVGKAIHVKELKLPEGVTVKADPESLVVHVTTKVAETTSTEVGEGTQPEVIKPERKEKED
ncbi:50S ribosomal protein L25 [Tundrisphaera lichenicola]|uniref:50S ribosomal protein L25 n=1 Tax=Tundrisphaera lichenicola TaxID=2029860 RepID=UPI003EBEA8CB